MQILPTLSCCHLPTTPIQKRRATNQFPPPPVPESTHAYCGSFHGEDFFLTVAQAASYLGACLPCPPSPLRQYRLPHHHAIGEGRNRQTHGTPGRISPPSALLFCTLGPWPATNLYTLRQPALAIRPRCQNLRRPGQPGAAVVSFFLFFFLLTPVLLPAAEQTRAFRRRFQTLPEMGSKGWSSGLCSR